LITLVYILLFIFISTDYCILFCIVLLFGHLSRISRKLHKRKKKCLNVKIAKSNSNFYDMFCCIMQKSPGVLYNHRRRQIWCCRIHETQGRLQTEKYRAQDRPRRVILFVIRSQFNLTSYKRINACRTSGKLWLSQRCKCERIFFVIISLCPAFRHKYVLC